MQFPIRVKFLAICIGLVLLTTLSLSSAYFLLARQDQQRESRERIQVGFDIIFDGLTNLIETHRSTLVDFLEKDTRLKGAIDLYLQQDDHLTAIRAIAFDLTSLVNEVNTLKDQLHPDRFFIYDPDSRLLVAYQHQAGEEHIGSYVISETGQDTYLPMDDPAIQTTLMREKKISDAPLPEGVVSHYPGEIPETVLTEEFTDGLRVGVRITVPALYYDRIIGVFVSEVLYTNALFQRYAALSKTEVNVFADSQWSTGTLSAQQELSAADMAALQDCQIRQSGAVNTEIAVATIEGHDYYQGRCAFMNRGEMIGAVTVSLSRDIEKQAILNILLVVCAISGGVLVLTILFSVVVSHRILRMIHNIMRVIDAMADGDLRQTATVTSGDEFGLLAQKLNMMTAHLQQMVAQVQQSGIQVTSSSTELAATAKQQEITMRHQTASTQNVVLAVQEIAQVTTDLGRTVEQVADMSEETAGFASNGQEDLARMEGAMERMEHASQTISERLKNINEKTENITSVVTTITKVADQTNLLSLNAAIEAEKAGEYGRGFTVVATEIRRLADQTAVATLDIEQMVQEMQETVSAGVSEMETFMQEVQRSADDVERISMQLTRIIEQVQALSPRFEDVNVTMGIQAEHAHEIEGVITKLGEEMQQTTESLKESFWAIGQLNEAAKGLQYQVIRFKVE